MKIGIITILKVNNYGAELQAYATQAALKKCGYDAEIIDYLFYKHSHHKATHDSRPLFKFSIKKWLSEKFYPIITSIKEFGSKTTIKRKERFSSFHTKHTALSQTFQSINELYASCPDYDVYMVGSDQVWNPGIFSSLKPYFLDFAPNGKRRVAYASSFGVSSLPGNVQAVYKKYLEKFDAIGVRESNGKAIVEGLGLTAEHVLDPTLLLDRFDWEKVSTPYPNLPLHYVAVYELTPSPYVRSCAYKVAKDLGCSVVRICKSASMEDKNAINVMDAGPSEFLHIIMNAQAVITNSFHGTAFSVNFNTPFLTIVPKRKDNNSRLISLLGQLDLTDRIIYEGDPCPEDISMDFARANQLLSDERKKSFRFLERAINGNKA